MPEQGNEISTAVSQKLDMEMAGKPQSQNREEELFYKVMLNLHKSSNHVQPHKIDTQQLPPSGAQVHRAGV